MTEMKARLKLLRPRREGLRGVIRRGHEFGDKLARRGPSAPSPTPPKPSGQTTTSSSNYRKASQSHLRPRRISVGQSNQDPYKVMLDKSLYTQTLSM